MLIEILVAGLAFSFVEWGVHKYILHGLGKNKKSFFHHHWKHHNRSRKNGFVDPDYTKFDKGAITDLLKEILGVMALVAPFFVFYNSYPAFVWTLVVLGVYYQVLHTIIHIYPKLGRILAPWHVDHHMVGKQDKNWGVVTCLTDYIMGTRLKP